MIIWHPLFPIPGFRWSTIWSRRSTSGNGATPSSSERSSGCASPSCCGTPSLNPADGSSNQQPRPQQKWSVSSLLNRPSEDNASYFFWLAEGSTNCFSTQHLKLDRLFEFKSFLNNFELGFCVCHDWTRFASRESMREKKIVNCDKLRLQWWLISWSSRFKILSASIKN